VSGGWSGHRGNMASDDELRRIATIAAESAAERVAGKAPNMGDIEKMVDRVATRAATDAAALAAKDAVVQTLIGFGLDPTNRNEILKDMLFLSEMRSLSAASKKHIVLAVVGTLTTAIIAAVVLYAKAGGKI
jgi:hypothetical protein